MHKTTTRNVPTGKRDRSKVERQAKILTAARMLFTELGYEAATLNQIATIAGLGKGTIFNYVTDKRDLIFLIFHQDITSLVEKALAEAALKKSFAEQILIIAELHYRLYAQNPKLTRILLDEVRFHSEGVHLDKFLELRMRLIKGMEQLVIAAQKEGVVSSKESATFIAQQLFFCFSTAVREWLITPHPEWRAGLRLFRRNLNLFLDGAATSRRNTA